MTSSRELDTIVAEKVMGWTESCGYEALRPDKNTWDVIPKYSTSVIAAWNIMDRFTNDGSDVSVSSGIDRESRRIFWQARIEDHLAYGDSAPHAICLAALKSVGVDVERD